MTGGGVYLGSGSAGAGDGQCTNSGSGSGGGMMVVTRVRTVLLPLVGGSK